MILIDNFSQVVAQIESERGVSREILAEAIEQALVAACRKKFDEDAVLEAVLDRDTGEATIYQIKTVVTKVYDDYLEISLENAQKMHPNAEMGQDLKFDVTPKDFGRIAAQTAKQVIVQRIREAEKNVIYAEYKDRVGEILVGSVQRVENKNYLVNLGRAEAILYPKDQIPGERFTAKEKIRVYISEVEKGVRGTVIHISRSDSGFLRRLFELEIPEINDGIIEIVGVSRDPGRRAKVAVRSHNASVGAVGTCVGHMGGRIQSVIKELGYEKIDVLEWSENPRVFIANALKPAKIAQVIITDESQRMATVVVAADQLSLAIGKAGVNVKLAVRLTGWRLDILSEEDYHQKADTIKDQQLSIVDRIKQDKDKEKSEDQPFVVPDVNDVEVGEDHQLKASELAKILKMKTQDMIEKALTFGIEIESARSVLTTEQVNTIKENI